MIRYGLIGAGAVGRKRAACLKNGQLIAVHDVDPAHARALAGSDAAIVEEAALLFENRTIDAIIIATRHDSLAELTLRAMRAGKHVLVEKPAARNAAELAPLLDAEPACGVRVRVGYNHRFHPALAAARRLVEQGEVGELFLLRGRYGHGGRVGYEREWRAQPAISGGGELIDQGVHLIDLARWFLGDFDTVRGRAATLFWDMTVDDNAFVDLQSKNGATAWLHASCSEWKNLFSLEIYGRGGKLQIEGLGGSYGVEKLTRYRMKPEMGPPEMEVQEFAGPDESWRAEIDAFEHDITNGVRPSPGLADAFATLKIVDEIYRQNRPG